MSLFHTDLEGERLTRTGTLHYLFAVAAFALTYTAISGMTPTLAGLSPWQSVHGLLDALHWICLVALILLIVTLLPRWRIVFGLFERAFLIATNLWLLTVAVCLAVKAG